MTMKKLGLKLGKKKQKAIQEEDDWGIEAPVEEESDWDLSPKQSSRGGKRYFSVKIGYDDHGVSQSDLLMEVIASRNIVPEDWDETKWSEYMHHVGQIPFYVLQADPDRYHLCIYAAELLRKNREVRDKGIDKVQSPTHDLTEAQPALDGTTWGGLDDEEGIEGDFGLTHSGHRIRPKTVRDQVDAAQKAKVEKHKAQVLAAQVAENKDPYILKWVQAEKTARTVPRAEWEGQLDFEFESMVKYCYGWLRDINEVPKPYPTDSLDLFWPRKKMLDGTAEAKVRREAIVAKVISFWRKSVKRALQTNAGINLQSQSYRVILAAKKLEGLIEQYASNYRRLAKKQDKNVPVLEIDDDVLGAEVKRAAVEYFQAHFPVELDGAKPGPVTTADPDYVEYIRLCRRYKLEEGVLLHEQGL
jgi:hypothetical protein